MKVWCLVKLMWGMLGGNLFLQQVWSYLSACCRITLAMRAKIRRIPVALEFFSTLFWHFITSSPANSWNPCGKHWKMSACTGKQQQQQPSKTSVQFEAIIILNQLFLILLFSTFSGLCAFVLSDKKYIKRCFATQWGKALEKMEKLEA